MYDYDEHISSKNGNKTSNLGVVNVKLKNTPTLNTTKKFKKSPMIEACVRASAMLGSLLQNQIIDEASFVFLNRVS